MTDEFDRLLEGALAARAEGAPACGGVTDVRRRVRRRRQRTSALTVLPVLVGAGAATAWVRSSEQPSVATGGTDALSTTTDDVFATTTTSETTSGFRCTESGLIAGDAEGWLYFQSCVQYWSVGSSPASTTPDVEPTTTLWSGPSTASVVFANASTTNGVAMQVMSQHFGSGQPVSAPTKSATSFVMYAGPEDEPLAAAVATELHLPLQEGIDDRFMSFEDVQSPTVVVVIGDDLAVALNTSEVDEPTTVPAAIMDGTAMRCWAQSEVDGGEVGYRYFRTCEPTPAPTGTTTGDSSTDVSVPTIGATTTMLVTDGCLPGQYVIQETDTYRLKVAQKFDLTVEEMDAANTENLGYPAFYPGLVITIPCPSGS
ncbi:MAG: hypothetical protein ABMA25_09100 [Ilumatobacteraceae bacterium]